MTTTVRATVQHGTAWTTAGGLLGNPEIRRKISFFISQMWQDHVMDTGRLSDRGKRHYIRAINMYVPPKVGVFLSDKIAGFLETGWRKFDMKPGLLFGIRGLPLMGLPSRVIPLHDRDTGTVKFRTVKEASKGWIHPGYGGAHLVHRVIKDIPSIIRDVIERANR